MPYALVLDLARGALVLCLELAGPLLLVALAVGLLVSVLQAVTQIQEQTIAFVAKLFAVGAVFLLMLSWSLHEAVKYTAELLRSLPTLVS
ncbi:MAG TPA: flagellar biosynthetic protein FliQ [Longimicrobiales bacterium]|jgi:flagellar biosynthetic protein FliQ|nr:flagellar biosynthetic protein FliQ [Longimicrobiales bacterium]